MVHLDSLTQVILFFKSILIVPVFFYTRCENTLQAFKLTTFTKEDVHLQIYIHVKEQCVGLRIIYWYSWDIISL